MKVMLESIEVFVTLDKSQCQVVNARKQIANIIYSQGAGLGLAGQALAVKMWNGSDETDYSQEELDIIKGLVERTTAPCFIEAVEKAINESLKMINYGSSKYQRRSQPAEYGISPCGEYRLLLDLHG